jgi:DNA-binding NtrC family response regulator
VSFLLKVQGEGASTVRSFHLAKGKHLVGAQPDCDVVIAGRGVSRRHAEIEVLPDGGATVRDLGSKNGSLCEGRRFTFLAISQAARLEFGQVAALLHPAAEAVDGIAFVAPAVKAAGPSPLAEPSTQELSLLHLLIDSVRGEAEKAASGAISASLAAINWARTWLELLAAREVRLMRPVAGEDAVIAAARLAEPGEAGEKFRCSAGELALEIEGGRVDPRLRPFFELALLLLQGSLRGEDPRPAASAPKPGPLEAAAEPPAPGTLDPAMRSLYRRAAKVARGEISLVLLGESGTGKEVMARWLHRASRRAGGPFRAINCAALPSDLLEAELFGIEKGVATGVEARAGLLEQAEGGTLFLDEVGDMPLELQAKVLRLLENPALYRVGGRRPVAIDVRFLAATNKDLQQEIAAGRFREDLFHRLAGYLLRLPPLRERRSDIALLAAFFFDQAIARQGLRSPGLSRAALAALLDYAWPGNIRQLQNEIVKATLLLDPGELLGPEHLSFAAAPRGPAAGEAGAPLSLAAATFKAEREAFEVARLLAHGDPAAAREILGLSRTSYYRKLKELGLEAEKEEP